MLVRVLIERHFKKDKEAEGMEKILEMRRSAITHPGCVSGETLSDNADPCTVIIVSTWHSLGDWNKWESSEEHRSIAASIDPMLDQPVSVRKFVNPWDALLE